MLLNICKKLSQRNKSLVEKDIQLVFPNALIERVYTLEGKFTGLAFCRYSNKFSQWEFLPQGAEVWFDNDINEIATLFPPREFIPEPVIHVSTLFGKVETELRNGDQTEMEIFSSSGQG